METNNNSNDFNFDDIINTFDNIEINNNSRISADDEEFCKTQEKLYKDFISYTDNYINYLKDNTFSNEIYNSNCLINSITETRNNKKCNFINDIVHYFRQTYKVTLTSESINKKYGIEVTYNNIIDEIINQLDGYSFTDKAEKEVKDEFKETIKHNKIKISSCKISFDSFFYANCYNYGSGNKYEVAYSYDEKFKKLFKSLAHYLNIDSESFSKLHRTLTSEYNDLVFKTHDIDTNKIKSLKLYKNGKIDIEFSSAEYARQFAKEYCGYIEKSA